MLNLHGVVDRVRAQVPPGENDSHSSSQYSTAYKRYQARHKRPDGALELGHGAAAIGEGMWEARRSHLSDSVSVRTPQPSGNAWEAIFGRDGSSIADLTAYGDQPDLSLTDHDDEITELEVIQGYAR